MRYSRLSFVCLGVMASCGNPSPVDHRTAASSPSGATSDDSGSQAFSAVGNAAAAFAPDFSMTCFDDYSGRHLALDLDANGSVTPEQDGAILLHLMSGKRMATVKEGTAAKEGRRAEFDFYYERYLRPLGLDVDGDGKVNARTDGKIIVAAISPNVPNSTIDGLAAPGHKVDYEKLSLLLAKVYECYGGTGYAVDAKYKLKATPKYFRNWGGKGFVWMWSEEELEWTYLTPGGDLFRWTRGTDPAEGRLLVGQINVFYNKHPELLVDLVK